MNTSIYTRHDREVLAQGKALVRKGWKTFVHLPGYTQPPTIGGYIPDVYAMKDGQRIVIEVEDRDSMTLQHTKDQLSAFSRWEKTAPGRKAFLDRI